MKVTKLINTNEINPYHVALYDYLMRNDYIYLDSRRGEMDLLVYHLLEAMVNNGNIILYSTYYENSKGGVYREIKHKLNNRPVPKGNNIYSFINTKTDNGEKFSLPIKRIVLPYRFFNEWNQDYETLVIKIGNDYVLGFWCNSCYYPRIYFTFENKSYYISYDAFKKLPFTTHYFPHQIKMTQYSWEVSFNRKRKINKILELV